MRLPPQEGDRALINVDKLMVSMTLDDSFEILILGGATLLGRFLQDSVTLQIGSPLSRHKVSEIEVKTAFPCTRPCRLKRDSSF
jgi:hypothetical protein